MKCWADICRVCKKLRKFHVVQLERQFVQHYYRSPLYFGFVTIIAVLMSIWGAAYLYYAVQVMYGYGPAGHGRLPSPVSSAVFFVAGAAFLLPAIGLVVAVHVPYIRDRHWEKLAVPAAVSFLLGFKLLALAYQSRSYHLPLIRYGDPSNYTNVSCPGLLDIGTSVVGPAFNSTGSLRCAEIELARLFGTFLLSWVGPLCLTVFGLDFRLYAPLLVTDTIINFFGFCGSYYGATYIKQANFFPEIIEYSLAFMLIVLPSLLWVSLSSESAARGAWIRKQNW